MRRSQRKSYNSRMLSLMNLHSRLPKSTIVGDLCNINHETYPIINPTTPISSSCAQLDSILPAQSPSTPPSTSPSVPLCLILHQVHHIMFLLTLTACKHGQSQESINLNGTWLPKSQLLFMKPYNMNTENSQCKMNFQPYKEMIPGHWFPYQQIGRQQIVRGF